MGKYILEVCVDSAESAEAAAKGGADRVELCGNLVIGGTTPETDLLEKIRSLTDIKINVLIRPRYGDFLYTEYEFDIICRSVERFRRMGANAVVVGCLLPDGSLDVERMFWVIAPQNSKQWEKMPGHLPLLAIRWMTP